MLVHAAEGAEHRCAEWRRRRQTAVNSRLIRTTCPRRPRADRAPQTAQSKQGAADGPEQTGRRRRPRADRAPQTAQIRQGAADGPEQTGRHRRPRANRAPQTAQIRQGAVVGSALCGATLLAGRRAGSGTPTHFRAAWSRLHPPELCHREHLSGRCDAPHQVEVAHVDGAVGTGGQRDRRQQATGVGGARAAGGRAAQRPLLTGAEQRLHQARVALEVNRRAVSALQNTWNGRPTQLVLH